MNAFWANVFWGKRLLGRYLHVDVSWANDLLGKCLSRQTVLWANV
jgi:hypothetical protein